MGKKNLPGGKWNRINFPFLEILEKVIENVLLVFLLLFVFPKLEGHDQNLFRWYTGFGTVYDNVDGLEGVGRSFKAEKTFKVEVVILKPPRQYQAPLCGVPLPAPTLVVRIRLS
jgi:hypothetical protein